MNRQPAGDDFTAAIMSSLIGRHIRILASVLAFQLLVGVPLLAANKTAAAAACLVAAVFAVWIPYLLLRKGRVRGAAYFGLSVGFLIAAVLTAVSGGVRSPALVLQVTLAVNAAMILGRRFSLFVAGTFLLLDGALAALQVRGVPLPVIFPMPPLGAFLLLTIAFLSALPVVILNVDWLRRLLAQRERALDQSAGRLNSLVNSIDGVVWEAHPATFQFTFVSEQAESFLGYPRSEWTGNPSFWIEHLHPEDRVVAESYCRQAIAEGRDYSMDYRMLDAAGKSLWVRAVVTLVRDGSRVTGLRGILLDVTGLKASETALRDSEQRYAWITQATADGIWDRNLVTGEVYYSPRWKEILGYRDDQFPNTFEAWLEHLHPEEAAAKAVAGIIADPRESFLRLELRMRHRNGSYRWVLARARIIRDEQGKATRILGSIADITDRKETEDALRKQEQRWMLAVEANGEGIWDYEPATGRLFRSARWHQLLGYAEGSLGEDEQTMNSLLHPDDRERVSEQLAAYRERRADRFEAEFRVRAADGGYRWVLARGKGLWSGDGALLRLAGSLRDITAERLEEMELRAARERARILADLSQVFWANWEDPQEALAEACSKIYPDFADICFIRMISADRKRLEVVESRVPAPDPSVQRLSRPVSLDAPYGIAQVARTGIALFSPEFGAAPGGAPVFSPEHMAAAAAHGIHSVMIVPLRRGPLIMGVMSLARENPQSPAFTRRDLDFAQEVADRTMAAFSAAELTGNLKKELAERRALEAERENMLARLRELTTHAHEAGEEERRRIAREIHDELGQQLTALKMRLEFLFHPGQPPERIRAQQDTILRELEHSIRTTRNIATELRPGVLDSLGLVPALEWLVRDFQAKQNIPVTAHFADLSVEDKTATAIFRVTQEALTNVVKHARASHVWIDLAVSGDSIRLEVSDDGIGIRQLDPRGGGFGLVGMQERAALAGGSLEILTSEAGGARLRLTLPLAERKAGADALSARR